MLFLSTCAFVYQEVSSLGVKNVNSQIWELFSSEITLSYDVFSVGTIKIDRSGINQVVNSERKRKMNWNSVLSLPKDKEINGENKDSLVLNDLCKPMGDSRQAVCEGPFL